MLEVCITLLFAGSAVLSAVCIISASVEFWHYWRGESR